MNEKCRGIEYRYGSPVACSSERGKCLFHDAEGKMFPEDAWGRRLPYDEETKRHIEQQMRRSRGYDGGVEDERAAIVEWLKEVAEDPETLGMEARILRQVAEVIAQRGRK